MMNVNLISVMVAVVAVGISLAGLMLAVWRGIRHEMRDMRSEMRHEIRDVRQDMRDMREDMRDVRSHLSRVDSHIGELRERVGHVEGLLKGLRDAFVRQTASD